MNTRPATPDLDVAPSVSTPDEFMMRIEALKSHYDIGDLDLSAFVAAVVQCTDSLLTSSPTIAAIIAQVCVRDF